MASLEKEIKILEDELLRLREEAVYDKRNGTLGGNHILQLESLKGQEKLHKAKVSRQLAINIFYIK